MSDCNTGREALVFPPEPKQPEELFRTMDQAGLPVEDQASDCVLDRKAIFAQVEEDMELLGELLDLLLDSYPAQLDDIREGITADDLVRVREAAHSLKGSLVNFQATAAVELASTLEMMARDGNLDVAHQKLKELEAEMDRIHTALTGLRIEVSA